MNKSSAAVAAAGTGLVAVLIAAIVVAAQGPGMRAQADDRPLVPVGGTPVPSLAHRPVTMWTKSTADLFGAQIAAAPGTLSVAGTDPRTVVVSYSRPDHGYVMAVDATSGKPRWNGPAQIDGVNECDFTGFGELMCYATQKANPTAEPTGVEVTMLRPGDGSAVRTFAVPGKGDVSERAVGDGFVFTFAGPVTTTYVSVSAGGDAHWTVAGLGGKEARMTSSPISDLVAIKLDDRRSTVLSQRRSGRILTSSNSDAPGFGSDDDISLNSVGFSVNEPSGVGLYDTNAHRVGAVTGVANLVAGGLQSGSALSGASTCPLVPFIEMNYSGRGEIVGGFGVANAADGKVLWKNSRTGIPLDLTCVGAHAMVTGLRSTSDSGLVVTNYDLRSGEQQSTYEFPTAGVIVAGFDADSNASYAAAVPGSEKAIAASAYSLATGTQLWEMTLSDVYWSPTLGNSFWGTTAGFYYVGTNSDLVRLGGG